MTNLDENFINSYINRTGFWYAFKRSVNDIGNLFILFRYLQVYEGLNWHNQQKEFSNILIKEKLLIPSKSKEDSSANSRGIKKVLELLGLCFVDKNEKLQITESGKKFLESASNDELYEIKTNQLLKYQINNPLIKSNNFKEMQIKPFVFLLKLLSELDNQSINSLEYKLFVSRAHHMNGLEDVTDQIKLWRSLNENEKENIKNKIINSEIYHKISGYAAYSMVFFGKSSFTDIADHDDEKIIFLKNNKIEKINKILEDQSIFNYNYNLSTLDKFMSFYGCLQNKHDIIPVPEENLNFKPIYFNKKNEINEKSSDDLQIALWKKGIKEDLTNDKSLSKEDKEKKICNMKIEDFFFLIGRTLNALKNEKIIYIKDLLIWDKNNLKQMQGMGLSSINEISEQLDEINKKYDVSLKFSDSKDYSIVLTNNLNNNLFKKIDEIDFSVRTMNCLKNEDIIFIGDLVTKTQSYMLHAPNFGRKSLQEIKNVLDSMSLYLGMEIRWPPKDTDYPSKVISYDKSTKFIDLNDDNKVNFFRSIEIVFENVRIISVCKNLEIENLGDLHQKIDDLTKIPNIGAKSIDEIKIELIKYISLPIGVVVNDWKETKKIKFEKFSKKLSSKIEKENSKDFENLQYLDEEIKLLMHKINFKRQDIIDYHYGLDGTGIKTLQESGNYFNVTRERIRQITSKYLRIISKKNITGLIILKKVEELLIELCPTSCVNFEKYLLDNKITNKRYMTRTLLSLFNLFLKKNNFELLEKKSIIEYKHNPKYSKLIKFVYANLNNYGCIKTSFLSKKFNLNNKQVIDLLNFEDDISFIDEDWLYDNDKSRNRLFNILQKIFNVNSEVNKFHLLQAIKRVRRLPNPPSFEALSKYCQKELSATIDNFKISVPKNQIHKFFYNSKREVLSDIELAMIKAFKNSDSKILTFNQVVNKLMDQKINTNSANIYISGNTPVLIKVNPACYVLVGTKLDLGEADEFYKNNKGKGVKIITDYDHNEDGKIWIGYEINERTRGGKNFSINSSIYEILKGKYNVKGMNHKLNVTNKMIGRTGNEMFKDMLNLGDEIIFTFDLNRKNVEIEVGQKVMQNKYN